MERYLEGERPRVADLIPRMQLRGPEIFAQHLEVTLQPAFDSRLFVLFGRSGPRPEPTSGSLQGFSPGVRSGPALIARGASSLRHRVSAFRPDIITSHGGGPLRVAVLAGLHRIAPIVYVRILDVPPSMRTPGRMATIRAAYRQVDTFVARSESLMEELVNDFGVPVGRVRVIPNARMAPPVLSADQRETVRSGLGLQPSDVMAVWVGRIVEQKDPFAAMELSRRLSLLAPSCRLVMVGDGPMASQLQSALRDDDRLVLAGERTDAARVIAAADLMVSTSVTEGMPGVFVEALMAGVPVVTYDVGGNKELVADGVNATVVPPGDLDRLTDGVARLVAEPDVRTRMAVEARRAGLRHDIRSIAPHYEELYEEVLGRRADTTKRLAG